MTSPELILKETFGYDEFLPFQRETIENVLAGKDTLAIMPTGGGKSLCYQLPALILDGLTLVVSPLIALMKDQVEQMRASGVPAVMLNSSLSPEEYHQNMEAVRDGAAKLLYLAPETLFTERIFALLSRVRLGLLTIDEAQTLRFPLLELLRQLINYETNEQKLLQMVLFSQDELRLKLAHARGRSFRSRIAMASTLDRLAPQEVEKMVDFRWQVASGGQPHPFEPRAVQKIFEHSQGIPRRANILADNSLLLAYLKKRRRITQKLVDIAATERQETIGDEEEKR